MRSIGCKVKGRMLLVLLIPAVWLTLFTNLALAQQSTGTAPSVLNEFPDTAEILRRLTDYDYLKQMEPIYQQRIANLEKELALKQQECDLKDKELAIKDQAIKQKDENFAQMKDIADRAIKLAETKKSSIWETYGPLAVFVGLAVLVASVL